MASAAYARTVCGLVIGEWRLVMQMRPLNVPSLGRSFVDTIAILVHRSTHVPYDHNSCPPPARINVLFRSTSSLPSIRIGF